MAGSTPDLVQHLRERVPYDLAIRNLIAHVDIVETASHENIERFKTT